MAEILQHNDLVQQADGTVKILSEMGGGGGESNHKYVHYMIINVNTPSITGNGYVVIVTNSNIPFTVQALKDYLNSNNIKLPISGSAVQLNSPAIMIDMEIRSGNLGGTVYSLSEHIIKGYSTPDLSLFTIDDKVIEI